MRSRRAPSPCPYSQRLWLEQPRPFVTCARLLKILDSRPGERVLEVGPGTGYHSLPVGERLVPGGLLFLSDIQSPMLEHTLRRAAEAGIGGVGAAISDATALPWRDASFEAAYLTAVLGEVRDQEHALVELRRVIGQDGRLVVGEAFPDPHLVPFQKLQSLAERAGFRFDGRIGGGKPRFHNP